MLLATPLLVGLGFSMIVPYLPIYFAEQGLPYTIIGVIYGMFPLARLVLTLPAGYLSDRFGHLYVSSIGLLLYTLTSALFLMPCGAYFFAVLRFLQGAASALTWAPLLAVLLSSVRENTRPMVSSLFQASMNTGLALGPLIAAFLVKLYNVRVLFEVCTVLCALALIIVLTYLLCYHGVSTIARVEQQEKHVRLLLKNRYVTCIALSNAIGLVGFGIFTAMIPIYIEHVFKEKWLVGITFLTLHTSSALSQYMWSIVASRICLEKLWNISTLLYATSALPILLLSLVPNTTVLVASVCAHAFLTSALVATWPALLCTKVDKSTYGISISTVRFCGDLGTFTGTIISGVLYSAQLNLILYTYALCLVIATIPLIVLKIWKE